MDKQFSSKDVLEEQLRQAQEKQSKEVAERLRRKEEELRIFLTTQGELERDHKEKEIDVIKKRSEFLQAIDEMKAHKEMKKKLDKATLDEYHYDYFPFIHGEQYEK